MTKTRTLVTTALFTALICIATMISIPVAFTNGYIHPGDSILFLAVILLPLPYGIFAAGVGSMLADLTLGYVHWALPTLFIKMGMAIILHVIYHKTTSKKNAIVSTIGLSSVWFIFSMAVTSVLGSLNDSAYEGLLTEMDAIKSLQGLIDFIGFTKIALLGFAILMPILLGVVIYLVSKKTNSKLAYNKVLAMTFSGLWMIVAYYIAAGIMYGNFITPMLSIPTNIIQYLIGMTIALLLLPMIQRLYTNINS